MRNAFWLLPATLAVGLSGCGPAPAPVPRTAPTPWPADTAGLETATLGGGCFWCTEAVFQQLAGVHAVRSGYAGGHVPNPTYEAVCRGTTGHAEVIQVLFDPKVISYADLLEVFFATHDPTTVDRQGADVGPQYRSAIFTHSDEQRQTAERVKQKLTESGAAGGIVVTEVTPFTVFYPAEDYHQNYYANNPNQRYCRAVIPPKLEKLKAKFPDKLR
jgi:peptide-methionine (S)-S-oxide reductase